MISWIKRHWESLLFAAGLLTFYILRYLFNIFPQRVWVIELFTSLFWENPVFKGDYWIDGIYNGTSIASLLVSPLTYVIFLPSKIVGIEIYSVLIFSTVIVCIVVLVRRILSRITKSRLLLFIGPLLFIIFPVFHTVVNVYGRIDMVLALLFVLLFVNILIDYEIIPKAWLKVTLVCLGILLSNLAVFQVFVIIVSVAIVCSVLLVKRYVKVFEDIPKIVTLFILVSIGFWLPLLVETKWLYFPSHDYAQDLVSNFGINSIIELISRTDMYFIGFTFFPALAVILWIWSSVKHKKVVIYVILVCVFGIILTFIISVIDVSWFRQVSFFISSNLGSVFVLAGVPYGLLIYKQKIASKVEGSIMVFSVLIILVIFNCGLPPMFMLFSFIVFYLVMPLCFTVILVIALDTVRSFFVYPRDFLMFTGVVVFVIIWDFLPYYSFESVVRNSDVENIKVMSEGIESDPKTTVVQLNVTDPMSAQVKNNSDIRLLSGYWEIFPSVETGKYYYECIYSSLLTSYRLDSEKKLLEQGLHDFNVRYLIDGLGVSPDVDDAEFIPIDSFYIVESNEDFVLVDTGFINQYISSEQIFEVEPRPHLADFDDDDMTVLASKRSLQVGSISPDYADHGVEFVKCPNDDAGSRIAMSREMCELTVKDSGYVEGSGSGFIESLKISNNFSRLNLKSSNGLITLKETYSPYWKGQINGDDLKPVRVNITNLGFYVGDKTGDVEISYSVPLIYYFVFWSSCILTLTSFIMISISNE